MKISDCLNSGVREGRPDVLNTPAHPVKPEFILKESGGETTPLLPPLIPSMAPTKIVPSRETPAPPVLWTQGMVVTFPENSSDGSV